MIMLLFGAGCYVILLLMGIAVWKLVRASARDLLIDKYIPMAEETQLPFYLDDRLPQPQPSGPQVIEVVTAETANALRRQKQQTADLAGAIADEIEKHHIATDGATALRIFARRLLHR